MIARGSELPIYAEADFCITGTIDPDKKLPEGPFGDHLGYYSIAHDFPVLRVEKVYHRRDAIWPFTVVGRPPQEDTTFGELIHELTGPIIPTVIPGVRAVNAVEQKVHDYLGVIPLLALSFVLVIHWPAFLALFGLGDAPPDWSLRPRMLDVSPIYFWALMTAMVLNFLLYAEELWRGLRFRQRVGPAPAGGV